MQQKHKKNKMPKRSREKVLSHCSVLLPTCRAVCNMNFLHSCIPSARLLWKTYSSSFLGRRKKAEACSPQGCRR